MPRAVHVPFERGMKKRSINLIPFHRHQELLHLPSGRTKGHDVIREGRSEGGREGGKGTFQPTTTAAAAAPAAAAPAAAVVALLLLLLPPAPAHHSPPPSLSPSQLSRCSLLAVLLLLLLCCWCWWCCCGGLCCWAPSTTTTIHPLPPSHSPSLSSAIPAPKQSLLRPRLFLPLVLLLLSVLLLPLLVMVVRKPACRSLAFSKSRHQQS